MVMRQLLVSVTVALLMASAQQPGSVGLLTVSAQHPGAVDLLTVTARHREVFQLHLNSSLLSNSSHGRASDKLRFSASLRDGPDLPHWLSYAPGSQQQTGLVYGVPPQYQQQFRLEVIVTNLRTYQTSRRELLVFVERADESANHEVQMKLNNVTPVDLLSNSRLERLLEIYEKILWPESAGRLHLSWLECAWCSATPQQPAGVLLRLASSAPFSAQLRKLQREVRPLWTRVPCPPDFKRSSAERHFRQWDFYMDWCQFKLFQSGELSLTADHWTTTAPPATAATPSLDVLLLPSMQAVPVRGYTSHFLATIGLPLLVAVLLCGALTCIMCCQGEHLRRPTEVQMVHMAGGSECGTLRSQTGTLGGWQSGTLRRAALRDVSPRLADQPDRPDLNPRITSYRDLSPTLSAPVTPENGGFNQHQLQPPPYTSSPRRRS